LLDKWLEDGTIPRSYIRCFLMKPGEFDAVDMTDPMSVYDRKTYIYDVSISVDQKLVKLVSSTQ